MRRFDFDAGMAPYDLKSYGGWQALSRHITPVRRPAVMRHTITHKSGYPRTFSIQHQMKPSLYDPALSSDLGPSPPLNLTLTQTVTPTPSPILILNLQLTLTTALAAPWP